MESNMLRVRRRSILKPTNPGGDTDTENPTTTPSASLQPPANPPHPLDPDSVPTSENIITTTKIINLKRRVSFHSLTRVRRIPKECTKTAGDPEIGSEQAGTENEEVVQSQEIRFQQPGNTIDNTGFAEGGNCEMDISTSAPTSSSDPTDSLDLENELQEANMRDHTLFDRVDMDITNFIPSELMKSEISDLKQVNKIDHTTVGVCDMDITSVESSSNFFHAKQITMKPSNTSDDRVTAVPEAKSLGDETQKQNLNHHTFFNNHPENFLAAVTAPVGRLISGKSNSKTKYGKFGLVNTPASKKIRGIKTIGSSSTSSVTGNSNPQNSQCQLKPQQMNIDNAKGEESPEVNDESTGAESKSIIPTSTPSTEESSHSHQVLKASLEIESNSSEMEPRTMQTFCQPEAETKKRRAADIDNAEPESNVIHQIQNQLIDKEQPTSDLENESPKKMMKLDPKINVLINQSCLNQPIISPDVDQPNPAFIGQNAYAKETIITASLEKRQEDGHSISVTQDSFTERFRIGTIVLGEKTEYFLKYGSKTRDEDIEEFIRLLHEVREELILLSLEKLNAFLMKYGNHFPPRAIPIIRRANLLHQLNKMSVDEVLDDHNSVVYQIFSRSV